MRMSINLCHRSTDGNVPNDQDALKWYGLIPSSLSFDSRVCLGIPSMAAAPFAPETRPDACRSARSITVFSRADGSEADPDSVTVAGHRR
jgi:hypothetical protein